MLKVNKKTLEVENAFNYKAPFYVMLVLNVVALSVHSEQGGRSYTQDSYHSQNRYDDSGTKRYCSE